MPITQKDRAAKLKWGSPLHRKCVDALRGRLLMSERKFKDRFAQIAKNEEMFQAYIPEKDVDALRRVKRDQQGIVDYRTIEIPYGYAVAMTAHTYYTSVFLSRSPILQLSGRHGEPETNRVAVESLLSYQMTTGGGTLPLFIWLLDPAKAGYGVIGHYWDEETISVRRTEERPPTFLGIPIPGAAPKQVDVVEEVPGYVGNRIYNVRPQDFFPDPRVPLVHFHKGEFCSRYVEIAWNDIYEGTQSGRYFNYDVLKKMKAQRDTHESGVIVRDKGAERVVTLPEETQGGDGGYDVPVGFIKAHEVYLKMIPSTWELGEGTRQEIFVFTVSTNGVLFGCVPLGELSGKFPFDILLDEVDGYTLFPKSTLERVRPMQDVITWLINTHFYNVRQALNNLFVIDPQMVVAKDLENPEPGGYIRLKPEMYGKDVRTALMQLKTSDVTQSHLSDIITMLGFGERITGVNDSIMGLLNRGSDRKTATEVRTSTGFGVNRLKTQTEWHSIIGFSPMTQKLVQRTQSNYTGAREFRMVGDLSLLAPAFQNVTPADIAGFYDYEPVDGTLPIDRFAQANLWKELLAQVGTNPAVAMQYDIARIFAWVANLAGIKNMAQFRLQPPEMIQQQLQAGNIVPLSSAMRETKNLNEPRQIPGMGATG